MEYRVVDCGKEDVIKKENLSYNEELDFMFEDINSFSHHDPTITYNDPVLDISNSQVRDYCETFLEQQIEGTVKSDAITGTKDNSSVGIESYEDKVYNDDAFKSNSKKDFSSDIKSFENQLYSNDSFKLNSKEYREEAIKNEPGLTQIKTSENFCVECGEDCEDWIKLLAHVCKNKRDDKVKQLKKKNSHRNVIVITDDVDENGKTIEYKVKLQDFNNNNVADKVSINGIRTKSEIEDATKMNINGARTLYQRGYMWGKEYPCDGCDRVFKRLCNLTQHKKSAHLGVHYSCNRCGQIFQTTSMLIRHVNSRHGKLQISEKARRHNPGILNKSQVSTSTQYFNSNLAVSDPFKLASKTQFLNGHAPIGLKPGLIKQASSVRPYQKGSQPEVEMRYWQPPKRDLSTSSCISLPSTNNWLQESKIKTGFIWSPELDSSKDTKSYLANGPINAVSQSTGDLRCSETIAPDLDMGTFQNSINEATDPRLAIKDICEGLGPHLHKEGHSLNGIPILQSCKSQLAVLPQLAQPAQATPWPVWLTHRATAQSNKGPYTLNGNGNVPRSVNSSRKGPWSVNGSLPYLRISLSSG